MKLTAIVAMSPERVIGKEGGLPWNIPDDLKFFKKHTSGHPVVMGRKTFDSIGKPLPHRQNIVLTHDPAWHRDGVESLHKPQELREFELIDQQVFIIGGEQVYRFFLPLLQDLIITHVRKPYEGDTHFPEYEELFPKSELIWEQEDFVIKRHFK